MPDCLRSIPLRVIQSVSVSLLTGQGKLFSLNGLVWRLKNNTNKFSRGAEVRTDARRQNPAGESFLGPHRFVSAKERGPPR